MNVARTVVAHPQATNHVGGDTTKRVRAHLCGGGSATMGRSQQRAGTARGL